MDVKSTFERNLKKKLLIQNELLFLKYCIIIQHFCGLKFTSPTLKLLASGQRSCVNLKILLIIFVFCFVFYVRLCGYPPFNGRDEDSLYEAIRKGDLDFTGAVWKKVSDEGIKFAVFTTTLQ